MFTGTIVCKCVKACYVLCIRQFIRLSTLLNDPFWFVNDGIIILMVLFVLF